MRSLFPDCAPNRTQPLNISFDSNHALLFFPCHERRTTRHPTTYDTSFAFATMTDTMRSTESLPLLPTTATESVGNTGDASSSPAEPRRQTSLVTGYILILFAGLCMSICTLLSHVSESSFSFPVTATIFLNSCIFTVFSLMWIAAFGLWDSLRLTRRSAILVVARGLSAFLGYAFGFAALATLPIGSYMTILSLSPLITSVLAAILLKDAFTWTDAIAVAVNIVGVSLVAQPTVSAGGAMAMGTVYALTVTLCMSCGVLVMRTAGTSVHYIVLVLSIGLAGLPAGLLIDANDLQTALLNFNGLTAMIAASLVSCITAVLNSRGMQVVRPGPALVIRSCNVPVSVALGLFLLGERLSWQLLLGASLVVASICAAGLNQYNRQSQASKRNDTQR